MGEPWIRVHANLSKRNVALRLAKLCRGDVYKAIGHLVTFWANVAGNCHNGYIRDCDDVHLEAWAGWSRPRGKFATWVREWHMDEDGRVPDWDEYMGALETRKAEDRQRKQLARLRRKSGGQSCGQSAGHPPDSPQDVRKMSAPARADEDGTVRKISPSPTDQPRANGQPPNQPTDGERAFLAAVQADRRPIWEAVIRSWYTGQNYPQGRGADARDVNTGLLEYLATSGPKDFAPKHVRGFVVNAEARRLAGEIHQPWREPKPRARKSMADEAGENALAAALAMQDAAKRRVVS